MSLGTLIPTLSLTDPSHTHVGPYDPIRGHVLLEYLPPTKTPTRELFAPVRIYLTLKGRFKVRFDPNSALRGLEVNNVNSPLFESKRCIFSGPVRISKDHKIKYPFQFEFPRGIQEGDDPLNLLCEWVTASDVDGEQALPSSKGMRGGRSGSETLFEYRLHVEAKVLNMDVTTSFGLMGDKGVTSAVVLYEQGPVTQAVAVQEESQRGYVVARLDKGSLTSEETTQRGFFGKTSNALFGCRPVFMLDCHVTVPTHFHRGQAVPVQIRVQHSASHRASLPREAILPIVQLIKAEVVIDAKLSSRSTKSVGPTWEGTLTSGGVIEMVVKETVSYRNDESQRAGTSSGVIGSQSWIDCDTTSLPQFYKGNEYTQTILFDDFTKSLSSTIKTIWIRQEYLMRVKCHILIAGVKEESFERLLNAVVHPPLTQAATAQPLTAEGGSTVPVVPQYMARPPYTVEEDGYRDEDLPPYTA